MAEESVTTLRCAVHPERETLLRCNRCDKPVCYQCAVQTPVGYRCRECVRGQQAVYFNATSTDLPLATGVALALGALLGVLAYLVLGGFGWFGFLAAILAGPVAGGVIAEAVRRAVRRRRAQHMRLIAAVACVVGVLIGGILVLVAPAVIVGASLDSLVSLAPALFFRLDIWLLAALAASTLYARLV